MAKKKNKKVKKNSKPKENARFQIGFYRVFRKVLQFDVRQDDL